MKPKTTREAFERYLQNQKLKNLHSMLPEYRYSDSEVELGYPYEFIEKNIDLMPGSAGSATMETLLLIGGLVAIVAFVAYLGNVQVASQIYS